MRLDTFLAQQRWLPCLNVDSLPIPPFAAVQVDFLPIARDGYEVVNDDIVFRVHHVVSIRHNATGDANAAASVDDIAFTWERPIPPGERGMLTFDTPCLARSQGHALSPVLLPLDESDVAGGSFVLDSAGSGLSCFRSLGALTVGDTSYSIVIRYRRHVLSLGVQEE